MIIYDKRVFLVISTSLMIDCHVCSVAINPINALEVQVHLPCHFCPLIFRDVECCIFLFGAVDKKQDLLYREKQDSFRN